MEFNSNNLKIKTVSQLKTILGDFKNRKNIVVMCHGVFDIVHPGHLRHLEYSKNQGDILVVSITSDQYISKGTYRPHITESLRAVSLSHISLVDYVVINDEPTPEILIKLLQPNFFAKGFEYTESGLPPATEEERLAVQNYGGKLIFTPGDIVYSSTELINSYPPDLNWEKISVNLSSIGKTWDDVIDHTHKFSGTEVVIVGDLIVDILVYTTLIGTSNKTPTLSVLENSSQRFVGGAGIVALHFKAANAKVKFITVSNDDENGRWAVEELRGAGIDVINFLEKGRPTTTKTAFVCNSHRLLKLDKLDNRPINQSTQESFGKLLKELSPDITIFSDFRHGIFNHNSIDYLIDSIKHHKFKVADSQVASRWGNISDFKGFELLTPNEREVRHALGDQDSTIQRLMINLLKKTDAKNIIIKLGSKGVMCAESNSHETSNPTNSLSYGFSSFADQVVDPVGSGDALLVYSSLSLASGAPLIISTIIGNAAAAIQCSQNGNTPISTEGVRSKLNRVYSNHEYKIKT